MEIKINNNKIHEIGVLTYWQSCNNYGQILQAWALQKYLIINGYAPYIIRFDTDNRIIAKKKWKVILKLVLFPLFLYKKYEKIRKKNIQNRNDQKREFNKFREDNFRFSKYVYRSLGELEKNAPDAEAYIVGSDQVWGQLLSDPENRVWFLPFGESIVRRISYAPSFGRKHYPLHLINELKNCLNNLDSISCREQAGVEICNRCEITDAIKVADPTLLLNKSAYIDIMAERIIKDDYIFVYALNVNNKEQLFWNDIEKNAIQQNWKIVLTNGGGYIDAINLDVNAHKIDATIPEWLSLIYYAKQVVTTSFHGVVFSLIFNKSFLYIPLIGKNSSGNVRVFDLLSTIMSIDENNDIIRFDANKTTDEMQYKLKKFIKDSQEYLLNSLK